MPEIAPGVSCDATYRFGRPRLAGWGIETGAIVSRFRGGDSIAFIASDYGLRRWQVEAALRFELIPEKRKRRLIREALGIKPAKPATGAFGPKGRRKDAKP